MASDDAWVDSKRSTLEGALASAREHLARLEIAGVPVGATLTQGTEEIRLVGRSGTVWLEPGHVTVVVRAPGFAPSHGDLDLNAGMTTRFEPHLTPTTLPEPPKRPVEMALSQTSVPSETAPSSLSISRITGFALVGAGLAAGVTGFFIRKSAASKRDAIEVAASLNPPAAHDRSNDDWQSQGRLGVAVLVSGAAVAAVGAYLALWGVGHRGSVAGVKEAFWAPLAGGGSGGFSVAGRY